MIERQSPVPYYEQLFEILRRRIAGRELADGERLPSEHELCREFDLSRATVRQTLQKLEQEGWATRVARRGVFASTPARSFGWVVQDASGFLENQLRHRNSDVETLVLGHGFEETPDHVSRALDSSRTFVLRRRRSLAGHVAAHCTGWFPGAVGDTVSRADDVLEGSGSVNQALDRAGHVTRTARRTIHALHPPAEIAQVLQVHAHDAVLRVRSIAQDENGAALHYGETWVLSDVAPLELGVTATASSIVAV